MAQSLYSDSVAKYSLYSRSRNDFPKQSIRNGAAKMRLLTTALLILASVQATAQDKYAVVVGVETYDTGTFDALDYANEDAHELGDSLTSLGFTTKVMTSDASSSTLQPSTPLKIATIMKTVANSCGPGDTLVISLSGHGVQFGDEPLLPSGIRETYFCPQDATLSDKSSLLKISSVVDLINRSAASRKLLLVDSCRENVLSDQGKRKSARRIELGSVHESRQSVPSGMAVLFSCSSKQFSWEHDELGHSVFTNYVINYLGGNAEERFYESGNVDLDGLVYYVRKRTNDYVFGKNLSPDGQLPILRGDSANWSFGRIELSQPQEFANTIGMEFKLIPAGEFMMGNEASVDELLTSFPGSERSWFEDAEKRHRVQITKPFYLAKHEVTMGQFRRFVNDQNYRTEAESDGKGGYGFDATSGSFKQDPQFTWKNPGFTQTDSHPVVNVSWNDAQRFLAWLSKQDGRQYVLPTEAQWEYACRAGNQAAFSFGDDPEGLAKVGNVADGTAKREINFSSNITAEDGHIFTAPVGRYRENGFGLFDMHGNVMEWCSDWYASDYYVNSPTSDPEGPQLGSFRVSRGGGWFNFAWFCRSACRSSLTPDGRDFNLGFRVAVGR